MERAGAAAPYETVVSRWRYQPVVLVASSFAAGVVWDRAAPWPTALWLLLSIGSLGVWGVLALLSAYGGARLGRSLRWPTSLWLLAVMVLVGAAWHHVYWHVYSEDDIGNWADREPRPARLRGTLVEEPLVVRASSQDPLRAMPRETRSIAAVEVHAIETSGAWRTASGRAHLVCDGELAVHAGQVVELLGGVAAPAAASNPGEFDYGAYLRGRRTRAIIHCDEPESVIATGEIRSGPSVWLRRVAGAGERRLVSRLPAGQAEIAVALLFGRYELLEEDVTERWMRTGTMHILAISGQHLAILASALWFMSRFVPLPRKAAAVLLGAVVVAYALLTGARPPVMRAAVLVCVLVGGIVLDRRARRANSLALALLIVLALNPSDLFDRGLQLSFLAVAALFWLVEPVWQWFQRPPEPLEQLLDELRPAWIRGLSTAGRFVAFAALTSAVVWLASVPLLAARFHLFSPVVVVLTLLLTPLATIALVAGLGLLLVDAWFPMAGTVLAKICSWSIAGMDWCVERAAGWPVGYEYVPGPPGWWVGGLYIGGVAALMFRPTGSLRWHAASAAALWVAVGFAAPLLRSPHGQLDCQVLAVGNGSAAVLRTPAGQAVLIDAGQIAGPRVGSRLIAPALWHAGISRLDAVFVSHADIDHFNGLPHLAKRFAMRQAFIPAHFARLDQDATRIVCEFLAAHDVPMRVCFGGDRFDFGGGVSGRLLHPPPGFVGTDNELSLVLLVEFRGRRILFAGDVEGAGLRRLLASEPVAVDVLIAPHHGSRRANPPELAEWCRPRLVVASQGRPRSGATLDSYRDAGIPVLTTHQHGAVRVRVDRQGVIAVSSLRGGELTLAQGRPHP